MVEEPGECRQDRTDAEVIGHDPLARAIFGERHVQIEPYEDALSMQLAEILEEREAPDHLPPTTRQRSMRRFE
jgi:hypothetical protein